MPDGFRVLGRCRTAAPARDADRGSVLLETALAVPLLMAVAVALAWGLSLATTSAALGDAARTAARSLARGEDLEEVLDRARAAVPGAQVVVDESGAETTVLVRVDVSPPVPMLQGVSMTLAERVAIPREWA